MIWLLEKLTVVELYDQTIKTWHLTLEVKQWDWKGVTVELKPGVTQLYWNEKTKEKYTFWLTCTNHQYTTTTLLWWTW
jgi:hypothetical protein